MVTKFGRLILPFIVFVFTACGETVVNTGDMHILQLETAAATALRVYFAHQSVGQNILDGLSEIEELEMEVRGIESVDMGMPLLPTGIVHSYIGRNQHPDEKIAEFGAIMRAGMAERTDVSLLKFCYVDTGHGMSGDEILEAYVTEMEALEQDYPRHTFVYVTMPLTAQRTSVKDLIKRFLNMPVQGRDDNVDRNRFNTSLREKKGHTGRLFDLASIQSTRPDGSRMTFSLQGNTYQALAPEYTYDGGHLNATASRMVAWELIRFLSNVGESRQ